MQKSLQTQAGAGAAPPGRRFLLKGGIAATGATLLGAAAARAAAQPDAPPAAPPADPDWSRSLGPGVDDRPYGQPSHFEKDVIRRNVPWLTAGTQSSVSFTPLQHQDGIITANGLFFERYHAGRPTVDPAQHRLMIHGMVDRPLLLDIEDLRRFPSESRIHFIECPANGGMEWRGAQLNSLQFTHGMIGCAEWTGVRLSTLFGETGIKPGAAWVLAEGADGAHMDRSIPLAKCLDDCMVIYGQNGEALRPEQGYPMRLLVPGWQGNINVKWLRRLQIGTQPWFTREETAQYTESMPDGMARAFTWAIYAKSVVTFPCPERPMKGAGLYEIRGLAWSGNGRISRVDISTDGGITWRPATLQPPVLSKALTRFTAEWRWDGKPAMVQSRAVDETGFVQPTIAQLRAIRGTSPIYNNNSIQTWQVKADGSVFNVQLS
ncbi:sulfite dehydrogenase [Acidisphaera rubrifaciens]|uniref:Molybdopterin binding oxidoreductase/sulfite oxidase n=1 Tax=Acidisphaera rubrifaciens HS-AP3 TaxID=1231350 RepID=A0A0D6P4Q8_9PROT|nr:sulfite dehydrogenase [Acidisphaera rubrifaciens]GAN76745.1 molybdopterin binding oxidoreductase/sulfite oxidase [Acidisphaera rubrifaciens HS-AP3]